MAHAVNYTPGGFLVGGHISFPNRFWWNLWSSKWQLDIFLRVDRFYLCQYHSDNVPYSLIHIYSILCNPDSCRRRDITHLRI